MDANFLSPNALLIQGCTMNDIEKAISRVFDEKFNSLSSASPVVDKPDKDALYKRKEAADILGVSTVTLDTWAKAGFIKSYKISTRIYYTKKSIDEALKIVNG